MIYLFIIIIIIFTDLFTRRNCKINVDIIEENITILRLKSNTSSSGDVSANANNNSDDIVYC